MGGNIYSQLPPEAVAGAVLFDIKRMVNRDNKEGFSLPEGEQNRVNYTFWKSLATYLKREPGVPDRYKEMVEQIMVEVEGKQPFDRTCDEVLKKMQTFEDGLNAYLLSQSTGDIEEQGVGSTGRVQEM
jgi:hypothetical protein